MGRRRTSAGLLLHRSKGGELEVLLVHPGGPFWVNRDEGAWSIPKGEINDGEDPLTAAKREFAEETGYTAVGEFMPLEPVRQPGGKLVLAWALSMDVDAAGVHSNSFLLEWPLKSGHWQKFPEVDRAAWFAMPEARRKILRGQLPLIDQLIESLGLAGQARQRSLFEGH